MSKKNERNTKGKIITAAWDLFYEQGYEDTTVEEKLNSIPVFYPSDNANIETNQ